MPVEPLAIEETAAQPGARRPGLSLSRGVLIVLGWLLVALGFVGIFLPVLPTTPLILLALWCFARSSKRFHDWLFNHPRFGKLARDWRSYGVIPLRGKILSVTMMTASLGYLYHVTGDWRIAAPVGLVLVAVACWIVTRPSHPPLAGEEGGA